MKIPIVVATLVAGLGFLIYMALAEGSIPSYEVAEVAAPGFEARAARAEPKTIRIEGFVLSVEQEGDPMRFTVVDQRKGIEATVRVESTPEYVKPDTFREGAEATLEGTYDPDARLFRAEKIWTKCPSKYQEIENADKFRNIKGYDAEKKTLIRAEGPVN
jgi:cytochrome c-type biogenesis protein CcmE